jgi:hypothetical protein
MAGTSDLLTPTLQEHRPRSPSARRPWRLGSQLYVAFFGGVIAVTAIALVNAMRLRVPGRVLLTIAGIGALGLAAVVAFIAIFFGNGGDESGPTGLQIGVQVISVAAWGLMFLVQRQWGRVYEMYTQHDEPHVSLLLPGLIAVLAGGALQVAIVIAVSG